MANYLIHFNPYHDKLGRFDKAPTLFVSGSWRTSEKGGPYYREKLPKDITKEIDSAIKSGKKIVIGDAPGIDRQVQDYLNKKNYNNVELLSQYSHARTDAQKLLRDGMVKDAEAVVVLAEYLKNPFPMRWIRIVLFPFVILYLILAVSIFVYSKHTITRMQVSEEQIVNLSAQVLEHQDELQQQTNLHRYDNRLDKIRKKYPKPLNRWNEYAELKKDIQPYLHNWFMALEDLDLTNREKVFCVVSFVYPQMATEDLANYLCITKDALPVRKNRIAKKFGVTSVELGVFLQKLANSE